ncbi:hypothetical protein MBLNU459_g6985t1 [Dothideomycetes sp. NU459]
MSAPTAVPLNKFWPIGFGVAAIVLYAIGGGLIGSACNNDDVFYCDLGLWQGGVALCCLAGIATLAWLILLIIYLTRRQRAGAGAGAARPGVGDTATSPPQPPVAPAAPAAAIAEKAEGGQGAGRFCGQCGGAVEARFCPNCGAQRMDV